MTDDARRQTPDARRRTDTLRVALADLPVTADLAATVAAVEAALRAAKQAGARILLTPECVLGGYPPATACAVNACDPCALAEAEDRLCLVAERLGLVLVLGTREAGPTGWTNQALVGGAIVPRRYRKRSLTPLDREHFTAGTDALLVAIDGWSCGIGICYDLRFAPVWADLAQAGADVFLVIAHMAGADPDPGVKARIVPQLCAVRAAEWATPLAFCNTPATDRWCASGAWDGRGMPIEPTVVEGLAVVDLPRRETQGPWYATLRQDHLLACKSPTAQA